MSVNVEIVARDASEQLTLFDEERSLAERAYLAGLLDGEGCIGVFRASDGGFVPTVRVCMTDARTIETLHCRYGGSYCAYPAAGRSRAAYAWSVTGLGCVSALRDALPFLVLKREQAELVLAVVRTYTSNGRRVSAADREFRRVSYERSRLLNKRGLA